MTVIDNDLDPIKASNQIILGDYRGNYSLANFSVDHVRDKKLFFDRYGEKSVILKKWGPPDKAYEQNKISYLVYLKRSESAPSVPNQYPYGEKPIKLGFKGNHLVYIEALFADKPQWSARANPYVLPK